MSNILIIKHGSLGDIAQISGAIQDIKENHSDDKVFILTTSLYEELFLKCPYINGVHIDQRLSRLNLIYLLKLKQMISSLELIKIYDLQNSSRTSFYRKFLFNKIEWSSTETTKLPGTSKSDFDNSPVLERFNFQLTNSNIITKHTLKPNFSWACSDIKNIIDEYKLGNYILLLPFCSPHLAQKKWPYYNELIDLIKSRYQNQYKIVVAPGPNEMNQSKEINAISLLDNGKPIDISQLSSLIKESSFVIGNDTGPAHMAAHLSAKGLTLFGSHTTAYKVSIERENFKAIQVSDLNKLSANEVFEKMLERI